MVSGRGLQGSQRSCWRAATGPARRGPRRRQPAKPPHGPHHVVVLPLGAAAIDPPRGVGDVEEEGKGLVVHVARQRQRVERLADEHGDAACGSGAGRGGAGQRLREAGSGGGRRRSAARRSGQRAVGTQRTRHGPAQPASPPVSMASESRRDDCVLDASTGQKTVRAMRRISWSCSMWPAQMSHAHEACWQAGGGRRAGGRRGGAVSACAACDTAGRRVRHGTGARGGARRGGGAARSRARRAG